MALSLYSGIPAAMVIIAWPVLANLVFCALGFYAIYHVYWEFTVGASRRRLSQENHCQSIKKHASNRFKLGLDLMWQVYKRFENHTLLDWRQEQFGRLKTNTFQMRVLHIRVIITAEPDNLKTIMSSNFKSWGVGEDRKKTFEPFLGEGIFSTDGAAWQHSRGLLRPNFIRSQISDLPMFEKHVGHLIQMIPRDGSMVDLQNLFFCSTLDIATEFLFGESNNSLALSAENDRYTKFHKAFNYCQNGREEGEGKVGFWSLFPDRRFKKECKILHEFVDAIIEKALLSHHSEEISAESRYVFLYELIAQKVDKIKMRSELLHALIAGRDTTASLLSNVWFELSKRPDIWARLGEEVSALGGEPPSYEQLKNMKYIRALLNESLRLYPIVPENARQALIDTVLPVGGGEDGKSPVLVRKREYVSWSVYAMHRREDLYGEDAAIFNPERWLDTADRKGLRVGWEYLPFNGGPRICIGQKFALAEASYITVRLMQEFPSIESRDSEPWREKLTLTCTGFGGCKVALTPRV